MASEEPPAKKSKKRGRQEAEESTSVEGGNPPKYQRGDTWFEDGNVVLVAEATAFRVYRGVLMKASEVFCDMFTVPQPPDAERWDDCPVVHLSDTAADVQHILSILYNIGGIDDGL